MNETQAAPGDFISERAAEAEDVAHEHHPDSPEYIRVAVALAFITALEVAVYYLDVNKYALIGTLIVMSAIKFSLVALFFMHLKFDSRVFSTFFTGGLVMAVAAFIAVLAMFRAF